MKQFRILFFILSLTLFGYTAKAQVLASDSLALVALYNSTNGPGWTNKTNWLTGPVSTWFGITVGGGRVIQIQLVSNGLTGIIPFQLGDLGNLTDLSLMQNQLSGTIPPQLGNLSNLTRLGLYINQLTGTIPAELGNLSLLKDLWLSENQLSGNIPSQLGNLSSLVDLSLHRNQLNGTIPAELGNLSNVLYFYLYENQLSGNIPSELGQLSSVRFLYLFNNQLSGAIPVQLQSLVNLVALQFQNNYFTFDNLEPISGVSTFFYIPQKLLPGGGAQSLSAGKPFTISFTVGGSANQYQWRKNGVNISGATSNSFSISSVTFSDAGSYELFITSPLVPGLTLQTEPVILSITAPLPFITTWKTDNPGTSATNQITIPTIGGGYNYNIYWEQVGTPAINGTLNNQTGNVTITFPAVGTYRVEISGSFPRIYFNNAADRQKLLTIEQWGSLLWTSMENAFYGCSNLTIPAIDAPDLSNVTNMGQMFTNASAFNQPIGHWDVSNVTNMEYMFSGATVFNQYIGGWDVSEVTKMEGMFGAAIAFDQDIGAWNVGNVMSMASMFFFTNFNQDISSWNVGSVTDMSAMFGRNSFFNQNIGAWNVGNVKNMGPLLPTYGGMFEDAIAFNQDISGWNVENVVNMGRMFTDAISFNQDIGMWNVSSVTNMNCMFCGAISFDQDISEWNVSNFINMNSMFSSATSFNQNIGSWDVSNLNSLVYMFTDATSFNQNLGIWNVSNILDMTGMLNNSGLSFANYDATLIGWSSQTVQPNITLGASGLSYCNGAVARDKLVTTHNWSIIGDVIDCLSIPIIQVKESGTPKPNGDDVVFSTTGIGNEELKQLEITNTGNTALVITDIQVTGDFSLESPLPPPIDPNNSALLSLRFAPTGLGARTGTLTILSNGDVAVFTINLTGEGEVEPEVYNVVTAHQNGKHDFLNIKNITFFPQNKVSIFDRWGNKVFERDGYDNAQVVFAGISDDNKSLPDGTYYYVIDKNNGDKPLHGFIYLRR